VGSVCGLTDDQSDGCREQGLDGAEREAEVRVRGEEHVWRSGADPTHDLRERCANARPVDRVDRDSRVELCSEGARTIAEEDPRPMPRGEERVGQVDRDALGPTLLQRREDEQDVKGPRRGERVGRVHGATSEPSLERSTLPMA
jgi:hypothetical protein